MSLRKKGELGRIDNCGQCRRGKKGRHRRGASLPGGLGKQDAFLSYFQNLRRSKDIREKKKIVHFLAGFF